MKRQKEKKGGYEPMKKIYFEQDELTLMAIYSAQTKQETIRALKETLEELEQEEADESRP